jgi:hypothetical protein
MVKFVARHGSKWLGYLIQGAGIITEAASDGVQIIPQGAEGPD